MKWEQIVQDALVECRPWKAEIILAAKEYIDANHNVRSNPCGWKSCHGPETDPVWAEYYRLTEIYRKANSRLWMATDVEYGDDPICHTAWNWRYQNVMARKCCHYMKQSGSSKRAAETMAALHKAELEFMEACGLADEYKSPCHYIEEAFPNLKSK